MGSDSKIDRIYRSGEAMKGEYSAHAVQDLLRLMEDEEASGESLENPLQQRLFDQWRDGLRLDPLIAFMKSGLTRERHSAAYYLGESVPRADSIRKLIVRFADDPLPYCRKAFVVYVLNTGIYDDEIAAGLARCLMDSDFHVRLDAINWAVFTTDERFEHFSELVRSGSQWLERDGWREPFLKRAERALVIAERLRNGESAGSIRLSMREEDSISFDYIEAFEGRFGRYAERRRTLSDRGGSSFPGYDDYETGALGDTYDNTGRMKGEMPQGRRLSDLTDDELAESQKRLTESVRQRGFDHLILSR